MSDAVPYLEHYFKFPDILIFFGLAFFIIFVIVALLMAFSKITTLHKPDTGVPCDWQDPDEIPALFSVEGSTPAYRRFLSLSQRFYELLYSGTSILMFITIYYLTDRFYDYYPVKSFLVKYESFFLLLLIVLSCIFNSFLDRVFTRLSCLRKNERSSCRITGMFYMFMIFWYVKYIYENNNYDYFITYFLGLMIGRFVYFDASFKDFFNAMAGALKNIPIMLLGLGATGFLAWTGFVKSDYLVKHIGVITNVCICHLFMCIAVFILFHVHPERILLRKRKEPMSGPDDPEQPCQNGSYNYQ